MGAAVAERPMDKARKNTPVRIDEEALRWARIASGYTGESMSEYISRIVAERARQDAERLHIEATSTTKPKRTKPQG